MKNLRRLLVLLAILASTAYTNAQTGIATLKDGAVTLNKEQPLQDTYILDASNFNFTTEQEAIAYFDTKNSEYVAYRPILHNNEIMVYLQIKAKPEWTKSDWNAYLAKNKIQGEKPQPTQQPAK